jgi:hypothetical protein
VDTIISDRIARMSEMARLIRIPVKICGLAAGKTTSRIAWGVVSPSVRAVSSCTGSIARTPP